MIRRTDAAIGERIQEMRTARKWSKAQLAQAAGLPVSTLRAIEGGAGMPDEEMGLRLATAFGCTLDHLLYEPRIPLPAAARWRAPRGASDDHVSL